ncbi:hypothetical protein C2857_004882 [Epichloe festucae Fl1]|uniref:Uncharacterized protein n=1 Tax=Epichloe festucae (strain Fl1) TaxID=877507 RepID=A0A7S9PVS1_EPIFF|nr:hypothetical protein C2857_004882 [Epichloe festucae Fl1]
MDPTLLTPNQLQEYSYHPFDHQMRNVRPRKFDDSIWQLDLTTREPRRYMSIISAPYFTSSGRSADWGFYCIKCIESKETAMHFRNKYTEDGFADHMVRYGVNHGGKQ